VLLVDDVLTTGATCHQAGRALRAAGCERVIVAVVARGEDVNSKLIRDDVNPPLKSPMQTEP
jgi:adenine/guanine phosphoribosyltransferase-like PRPP-binding protein